MPYKTRSLLHKNAFTIRLSGTYCYQKVQPRSQSSLHLEREPEKKVAEGEKKNSLLFILTFCHVLKGIPFEKKKKKTRTNILSAVY